MHRPRAELERNTPLHPIGAGCEAEALSIGAAEMSLARKAGSNGNFGEPHIGLRNEAARAVEADVAVVENRALANELPEQAIKLPLREPNALADLRNGKRLLQILFHELDG